MNPGFFAGSSGGGGSSGIDSMPTLIGTRGYEPVVSTADLTTFVQSLGMTPLGGRMVHAGGFAYELLTTITGKGRINALAVTCGFPSERMKLRLEIDGAVSRTYDSGTTYPGAWGTPLIGYWSPNTPNHSHWGDVWFKREVKIYVAVNTASSSYATTTYANLELYQ